MEKNEWKSDLALMAPLCLFAIAAGIGMATTAYMEGKVEIERLRLAQMQYQTPATAMKEAGQ